MTKITHLAYNRKFERTTTGMKLRDKPIASFTKPVGMCPECEQPVFGSPGQVINSENGVYTHKICRKKKRRL